MSSNHIEVNTLQIGSGQPWRQQYDINTLQNEDITDWKTNTPLPIGVRNSQAIVTKNRVYLLGGQTNIATLPAVFTVPINNDGTLGDWTIDKSLPDALSRSQAIITKNRVYLLGGWCNSLGAVSTVYTATINNDGTLGVWTTGTPLPIVLQNSSAIVTKNRVYLLGGWGGVGSILSTVYTAPINSDGTLGDWTTSTPLPNAVMDLQPIVTKNRVYLLGGHNGSVDVSTVFISLINADGTLGAWVEGVSLPVTLSDSSVIVTKDRVFLLGGHSGDTVVSTVYTAPINADGTLGVWTKGTPLPNQLQQSQAVITKNKVHLLGGWGDASILSTIYTASISGGLNDYSPYYDDTMEISE